MNTFNIKEDSLGNVSLTREVLNETYLEIVFSPKLYNELILPSWIMPAELYKSYRARGMYVKSITYSNNQQHYVLHMSGYGLGIHYHFESALWNHTLKVSKHTCSNAKMIPFKDHSSILIDSGCNTLIKTSRKLHKLTGEEFVWLINEDELLIRVLMGHDDDVSAVLRDQPIKDGYLSELNAIVNKLTGLVTTKITVNLREGYTLDIFNDEIIISELENNYAAIPDGNSEGTFKVENALSSSFLWGIAYDSTWLSLTLSTPNLQRDHLDKALLKLGLASPELDKKRQEEKAEKVEQEMTESKIAESVFPFHIEAESGLPAVSAIVNSMRFLVELSTKKVIGEKYGLESFSLLTGNRLAFNNKSISVRLDPIFRPTYKQRVVGLFQKSITTVINTDLDAELFANANVRFIYADDNKVIYRIHGQYFEVTIRNRIADLDTISELASALKNE